MSIYLKHAFIDNRPLAKYKNQALMILVFRKIRLLYGIYHAKKANFGKNHYKNTTIKSLMPLYFF